MFEALRQSPKFHEVVTWPGFLLGRSEHQNSLYDASGDVAHFDLEGRWTRARLGARTFLRGLDGAVLERFAGPHGSDVRLARVEVAHRAVVDLVRRGQDQAPVALSNWTVEALESEATRFLEAYRPVGIVPPDRYRSLIVQATSGCAWNGCLFCSLYKGQRHRALLPGEVRDHVRRVKTFVGSGVLGRRGVFLGEANALAMAFEPLLGILEVLHDEVPALATDISSFIDAFDVYRTREELGALKKSGLTRVFLGVESGDNETLELLGKPTTASKVGALVDSLKAGGVSVGVIFLAGLGATHVERSVQLFDRLPLDAQDVVYVSPLVVEAASPLGNALERRGLLAAEDDIAAEAQTLRARLRGKATVGRYDVRRWVYT